MTSGTEEEQLAQIKEWWQRNGKPLMLGAVIALVLVFGWQFWQKHQINQAQSASVLYQQLLTAALESGEVDAAEVSRLGNLLKKDFAGTHYAQYGSLFIAKVAVEAGRLDEAASELRAILDKPADKTLDELARQRLARVLAARLTKPSLPAVRNSRVTCWCNSVAMTRRMPLTARPRSRCPRMRPSAACK